jgi:hypothetical protein
MSTTSTELSFQSIQDLTRKRFAFLIERSRQAGNGLFVVEYNRDDIWQAYLKSFPEEERQGYNCNSCKAFIRQVGAVVLLEQNLKITGLWDEESPLPGIRGLAAYLKDRPISGLFYHDSVNAGTEKNRDKVRNVVWYHFHAPIPREFVNDERRGNVLGRASAEVSEGASMFRRACESITKEAIDTVLELIDQNSLYRGAEFRAAVEAFSIRRHDYYQTPEALRSRFCWQAAAQKVAVCRVRNTVIGTLLADLSEGMDLDKAVRVYEAKVAPANYKRPTALVTPKMVEDAKKRLEEMGLISALNRRRLDARDLTAAHAIYVYRPVTKTPDVFAELAGDQPVNMKELKKVEEITIEDFLEKVVPTAKDIRVLFERQHVGNLVTLTGPQDPEAKNLMKWDNSFAWSYTGGVGDSIKEKVKSAGGKVDGWLRASLGWSNYDDLDLHFHDRQTREHVYFRNKRGNHAWLDVDMNAGTGHTREPVENITCNRQLPAGRYAIEVVQFNRREMKDEGYTVEIEVNGETHVFGSSKSPRSSDLFEFSVTKDGQVTFAQEGTSRAAAGIVRWGIKTGQFHRVRALTLSPNHWTRPTGNRHFMFLLEGCVSDEATRPFLNEHLTDELTKDRKVTEVLGSKIVVAPAEGDELSGLGFSDTQRNHLYAEVEGAFKRVLKVTF